MARGDRLKGYNSGAAIPLLTDDLFRASWFPLSRGVHQVKIIGAPDGTIEYGEYVIRRGASHFNHSTFKLAEPDTILLRQALETLKKLRCRTSTTTISTRNAASLRSGVAGVDRLRTTGVVRTGRESPVALECLWSRTE